ncbi:MAG: hypothetical protein IPH85_13550 [Ignavibacteria bacterium]|nr:hypothetical protein [Ignavibacteria bacterium]MBK7576337.1 hypothetical protein [Ignavibacteria bacterium]MBK9182058.1 hypothetical protein [Ignavibacteria bacterium]
MSSLSLRIIFGTVLVWSMLLGLDLHRVVKVTVQLAHIGHHLADRDESLLDILKCLTHDETHDTSSSDSEHHRHHDHTGPTNCGTGCIAHVAVTPSAVVLPPAISDECNQLSTASLDLYTDKPLASIFQPPRA